MTGQHLGDLWGNYSQEDLYQIAISRPLKEQIISSIASIQAYESQALSLSPDGYYVCNSYGKDSIVMERLFKLSGVKYICHHNNVTIDPPELVLFGRKNYPDTVIHHPKQGSLPMYMKNKSCGPPTRRSRWCCELYKEQGGRGLGKAIGVRAQESARRKGMWQTMTLHRSDLSPILSPILYWTDAHIWEFIRKENMPYCSLYDEGFKRLGCIGCPMGGAKGMARDFARWPKYEALWKRGFQSYWDKYKGTPKVRATTCEDCEGTGLIPIIGTDSDVQCETCNGTGKVFGDRWIERFPKVDDLWDWWVSGKAYEGEGVDCQQFLW